MSGQHQIGIRHHLGIERIRVNDVGNFVFAGFFVLVRQHLHRLGRIHRRIPAHVRHKHEKRIDRIGVPRPGIPNEHVHHAVGRQRCFPGKRLVDPSAPRRPFSSTSRSSGPRGKPSGGPANGSPGACHRTGWQHGRWRGFGIWRTVPPPTRAIDAAKQSLQHMQRPAGMKPVGVRRYAPHGVKADGPADHVIMLPTSEIRPRQIDSDFFLERGMGQLGSQAPDRIRCKPGLVPRQPRARRPDQGNAAPMSSNAGTRSAPIGQRFRAPISAGIGVFVESRPDPSRVLSQHCALPPSSRTNRPSSARSFVLDHEPPGVRVPSQVVEVDLIGEQKLANQREHQ